MPTNDPIGLGVIISVGVDDGKSDDVWLIGLPDPPDMTLLPLDAVVGD